jgi:hypothetical protein
MVSKALCPAVISKKMRMLRIVVAAMIVGATAVLYVFGILSRIINKDWKPSGRSGPPLEVGYVMRVFSVLGEWIGAILHVVFVGSYVSEFRSVYAAPPSFFVCIGCDEPSLRR